MYAAQINVLSAPRGLSAAQVLRRWPSLADIAEAPARAGVRVTVLQAAWHEERLMLHEGVDCRFVDMRGAGGAAGRARRMARVLAGIGADVAHVHGLGVAKGVHVLSRCLPSLPLLLQDHADRPPRYWWQRPRWRRWYAAASGVAFTCPEQAQPFIDAGLFARHVRVFSIPESSSRFTPGDRAQARAASGLHGDPCVVWVGHLNPGKDPLTMLDGVAAAAQQLPGLSLWCAFGTAPMLDVVQARIDGDPRLSGRVHLLGRVEHAHVEILMRAADVFVSASHAESCGYAALEALACGTVPVVTDIPSFRTLTGNGRVGRLWSRGDALRLSEALIDASKRRLPPGRVRAHFDAELSLDAVGRKWAAAYGQLVEERHRRAG